MSKNKENSVQEELEALDAKLRNLDKENPFITPEGYFGKSQDKIIKVILDRNKKDRGSSVPEDYFAKLQHTILTKIAEDELTGIPRQVIELRLSNPFRVPDDYFKNNQSKILSQIIPGRVKVIRMRFNRIVMIAASVAALITCVWLLTNPTDPNLSKELVDISSSEVLQYVQNNIDEYDFYQIEELAEEEELGDLESMDIDQLEIENYLEEQMDDLNIEELL